MRLCSPASSPPAASSCWPRPRTHTTASTSRSSARPGRTAGSAATSRSSGSMSNPGDITSSIGMRARHAGDGEGVSTRTCSVDRRRPHRHAQRHCADRQDRADRHRRRSGARPGLERLVQPAGLGRLLAAATRSPGSRGALARHTPAPTAARLGRRHVHRRGRQRGSGGFGSTTTRRHRPPASPRRVRLTRTAGTTSRSRSPRAEAMRRPGLAGCSAPSYAGPDSGSATVGATCSDRAGNSATATMSLRYDSTAPSVSGNPDRAPTGGWYRKPFNVSFAGADALSGVASCTGAGPVQGAGRPLGIGEGKLHGRRRELSRGGPSAFKYDATAPKLAKPRVERGKNLVRLVWQRPRRLRLGAASSAGPA